MEHRYSCGRMGDSSYMLPDNEKDTAGSIQGVSDVRVGYMPVGYSRCGNTLILGVRNTRERGEIENGII